MTNAALIKKLQRLVDIHGIAQVAVWLNYRDGRSIATWISTGKIPRVRVAQVETLVANRVNRRPVEQHQGA